MLLPYHLQNQTLIHDPLLDAAWLGPPELLHVEGGSRLLKEGKSFTSEWTLELNDSGT